MPGPGRALLTSLVCVCVAASASAQYRFDSFTTSNGLPQNTVASVLQTRDGYPWIATYDGLVRDDGVVTRAMAWQASVYGVDLPRPAFYQTAWFSVAIPVALVLVGWGLAWLRVRRLQEAERRLTAQLGEMTADLKDANRQLEQLAKVDELTQLANRRRFSEVLDQEWRRAIREGAPIGLLMLDVDFFKRYNDSHGHQAGDACLQRVGAVLASRVKRPSDLAARYGGEEFAVVLPGSDAAGAVTVGEWIRAEVERQGIPHGASLVSGVVTVSVGAAVVTPVPGMEAASLVAAADAALYRAKEQGRNTVVASSMEPSPTS